MDYIFHRVSVMKNVQKETVEKAWNLMLQRMYYALGFGNFVFIPGFGMFFENNNYIFFTRVVYHNRKVKKTIIDKHKMFQIKNTKEDLNQIIYNTYMMPSLSEYPNLINTIRIKHIDTDPLDLAVFIEINREIIVKRKDLYIEKLGWFYHVDHSLSNWCQIMIEINFKKLKVMATTTQNKINMWIPKLIQLLTEKELILEQQSLHMDKTIIDSS
jgi:hypothetical protein